MALALSSGLIGAVVVDGHPLFGEKFAESHGGSWPGTLVDLGQTVACPVAGRRDWRPIGRAPASLRARLVLAHVGQEPLRGALGALLRPVDASLADRIWRSILSMTLSIDAYMSSLVSCAWKCAGPE